MKHLATATGNQNIQLVSERYECFTDQCIGQDDFLFVEEPLNVHTSFENISDSESNDSFSVFDNLSDFEEESNDDSENLPQPSEQGPYFPFPSEIFFLLYSYVHNVSRPKVWFHLFNEGVFLDEFCTMKIGSKFFDRVCTGCPQKCLYAPFLFL